MDRMTGVSEPHFILARDLGLNTIRTKGYEHIDLDLASNQAHAICGEHGSGKIELLLTLAGRMHRSEGDLHVAGIDATTLRGVNKVRKLAALGFFDNVNDVERVLRVRTVTSAELSLAGVRSNRAACEEYLDRWGLSQVADSNIEELTSYEYHRLGIALAMAQSPQVLAVQDVERDLTEHQAHKLVDELRELAATQGVTVVCGVTDYDLAACFDTATCITDGARAQQAAYLRRYGMAREVA